MWVWLGERFAHFFIFIWLAERFTYDETNVLCWELAESTGVERSEVVELAEGDCSRWIVDSSSLVVCSVEVVVIDLVFSWIFQKFNMKLQLKIAYPFIHQKHRCYR